MSKKREFRWMITKAAMNVANELDFSQEEPKKLLDALWCVFDGLERMKGAIWDRDKVIQTFPFLKHWPEGVKIALRVHRQSMMDVFLLNLGTQHAILREAYRRMSKNQV